MIQSKTFIEARQQQTAASTRAFITQDDDSHCFFEETAVAPATEETCDNMSLAFRTISDKRVKNVLGRVYTNLKNSSVL